MLICGMPCSQLCIIFFEDCMAPFPICLNQIEANISRDKMMQMIPVNKTSVLPILNNTLDFSVQVYAISLDMVLTVLICTI